MLTKVRLKGVMGKKFGEEWELAVSSPAEALRLIEANEPGVEAWIANNAETYAHYRVTVVYADDREEDLSDNDYPMLRNGLKEIIFEPIVQGASGIVRAIVGVVAMVAGFVFGNPYLFKFGAAMFMSGVVELLSPRPKTRNQDDSGSSESYYFNGPVNTQRQGNPVPLIYGKRVLVGSQPISASISIDEIPV